MFYQALPNKTIHLKWVDGKHSKIRLTGMAALSLSAVSKKLPMFVIGKSARLCR